MDHYLYSLILTYLPLPKVMRTMSTCHTMKEASLLIINSTEVLEEGFLLNLKNVYDEAMIAVFKRFNNLISVNLSKFTRGASKSLALNCPKLLELDLTGFKELTDNEMIMVSQKCTMLERVNVSFCDKLGDSSAIALMSKCKLKDIRMQKTMVTKSTVDFLISNEIADLTYINFFDCDIDETTMTYLSNYCKSHKIELKEKNEVYI